jgi:hypothetical protein
VGRGKNWRVKSPGMQQTTIPTPVDRACAMRTQAAPPSTNYSLKQKLLETLACRWSTCSVDESNAAMFRIIHPNLIDVIDLSRRRLTQYADKLVLFAAAMHIIHRLMIDGWRLRANAARWRSVLDRWAYSGRLIATC